MPVYSYIALDPRQTKQIRGTLAADTPSHAREQLRDMGYVVERVRCQRARLVRSGWSLERFGVGRMRPHAVEILRELSTLLAVGLPLPEAMQSIIDQRKQGSVRTCLMRMREHVCAGGTLASAMSAEPGAFDSFAIAMARVGEQSGALDVSLAQAASYLERSESFRNRLVAPLLYPAVVLFTGVVVGVFLMTYVVPQIIDNLPNPDQQLPLITRFVKGASDIFIGAWWFFGLISVGGLVGAAAAFRAPRFGRWADQTVLRIPVLGPLMLKQELSRTCMAMSTLLRSDVELAEAMQVSSAALRNRRVSEALDSMQHAVVSGRSIGDAAAVSGVLPTTLVNVFALGQQAGRLDELLERLGSLYDQQVAVASNRLIALLEPIAIVALVGFIGVIAFATLLPILQAGEGL